MIRGYVWGTPPIERDPRLVPVVVIHHNAPGLSAADAVERAFRRTGGVPAGPFAIAAQPPQGGRPPHTYTTAFGDKERGGLYDAAGANHKACGKLHDWLEEAFGIVAAAVGYRPPECALLDWEGFYGAGPDFRSRSSVQRWAGVRARVMQDTVVAAAERAWGVPIDASNYEDRPHSHADLAPDGKTYATTGIGSTSAPVFYAGARGLGLQQVKADAAKAIATSKAAGVVCRPWINEPELAEWVARFGVDEVVAWGSGAASSGPLQEWILRQGRK